jgi:hypothetical protein
MRTVPAGVPPRGGLSARASTLLALLSLSTVLPAAALDSFSPVMTLRSATNPAAALSPVHATLLPDGTISLIGVQRIDGTPVATVIGPKFAARYGVVSLGTPHYRWPASKALRPEAVPYDCKGDCLLPGSGGQWAVDDTLMCSGHTLLADGTMFVVSGTRFFNWLPDGAAVPAYSYAYGTDHNFRYDPATAAWTRVAGRMLAPGDSNGYGRWYGTATRLADQRVLITGGFDIVGAVVDDTVVLGTQTYNISVEAYDPANAANPRQLLSPAGVTPASTFNVDYSHVFQFPFALPGGQDVLMIGQAGEPVFMTPSTTPNWLPTGQRRPGDAGGWDPVHETATLMLPLRLTANEWGYNLGAIMTIGGGGPSRESRADIYDAAAGGWQPQRIDIGAGRHHPSAVILPDGRIFVIGGHDMGGMMAHPRHGVMLTPSASGYSVTTTASMSTSRGYHTVALLLPDGRVMVAGGRTGGATDMSDEQPTVEYFEPDYIYRPRPSITAAPTQIYYDTPFPLQFAGTAAPSELVLVALGSMTHSFDANQRSVELVHTQTGPTSLTGVVAGGERFAPPGHYMLFVLDENRRPSKAAIVRLSRL